MFNRWKENRRRRKLALRAIEILRTTSRTFAMCKYLRTDGKILYQCVVSDNDFTRAEREDPAEAIVEAFRMTTSYENDVLGIKHACT